MATWDTWVSGEESFGHVRYRPGIGPDVYYNFHQADVERMKESMAKLAEMYFAVGAKEVIWGVHGLPDAIRDPREVDMMRTTKLKAQNFPVASNHVFGSMSMGADPKRHAVDLSGAVYGVDNLYVADTSVLPATPGVNPMMPAMGLSHRIARNLGKSF